VPDPELADIRDRALSRVWWVAAKDFEDKRGALSGFRTGFLLGFVAVVILGLVGIVSRAVEGSLGCGALLAFVVMVPLIGLLMGAMCGVLFGYVGMILQSILWRIGGSPPRGLAVDSEEEQGDAPPRGHPVTWPSPEQSTAVHDPRETSLPPGADRTIQSGEQEPWRGSPGGNPGAAPES
jgi:hypothetical protein